MRRHHFLFWATLLAFIGSALTAAASVQEYNIILRGVEDATTTTTLPYRIPRLGVNAELRQYGPDELRRQIDLMRQANIAWVRQFVDWAAVETAPNHYDWAALDLITRHFESGRYPKLVLVLIGAPIWHRNPHATRSTMSPPSQPAAYGRFAERVAERYGSIVDVYQIWDEPNLSDAWGGLEPRSVEYVALLAEAYRAIHRADDQAVVLAAALAPTTETGPDNFSDLQYLRQMYSFGAQSFMDGAAAKPYGFSTPPWDRRVDPEVLNFSRMILLREEMQRQGDGHKPLWASAWGWNSLPDHWTGQPSIWGFVTADQQIEYTLAALDRVEKEWPWAGGMVLQHWQPNISPVAAEWGFSLINQQGEPAALWQKLAAEPPETAATSGLYPAANSFASYMGVWTFSSLGADIGWVQDSRVRFSFQGESVGLIVRRDDYAAYLYAEIDGRPAEGLPLDSEGNAYLVLTSPDRNAELSAIPIANNLSTGTHLLELTADRGWDRWALAGFSVGGVNPAATYGNEVSAGIFVTLVSGLALVYSISQARPWRYFRLKLQIPWLRGSLEFVAASVASVVLLVGMLLTWSDRVPSLLRQEPVPLVLALFTVGLIQINAGPLIAFIGLLALFIIVYHRLYLGLVLSLFWSPFFLFPVELYVRAVPLTEVIILLTAFAWLLNMLVTFVRTTQAQNFPYDFSFSISGWWRRLSALDWLAAAFMVSATVALTWSPRAGPAWTEWRTIFLEPVLFYAIFRTARLTNRQVLSILDAMLLAGAAVAGIGLVQYVFGSSVITAEAGVGRLAGVYGSPNNVALFLGRCLPFLVVFAWLGPDIRRRVISIVLLLVMFLALLLTQSAGALLIGVPLSLTVIVLIVRRRVWLMLIFMLLVALLAVPLVLQSPRFARILDMDSGTNFFRLRVWQSAITAVQEQPITGLGLDQFLYAFRGRYILPDAWQEPDLSHPHNIILDFWLRLGAPGLVLILFIQIAYWRLIRRRLVEFKIHQGITRGFPSLVVLGCCGGMVNLIAHGLIDNSVFVIDLAFVFLFFLALAGHTWNSRAIDEPLR